MKDTVVLSPFKLSKWLKESESESCSACPTLCDPMDYTEYMGFSRPEYWSGQPIPSPGDLPDPGIEPGSPALQVDSVPTEPSEIGAKVQAAICEPATGPRGGRVWTLRSWDALRLQRLTDLAVSFLFWRAGLCAISRGRL